MKVTSKVHGEMIAARRAKRAARLDADARIAAAKLEAATALSVNRCPRCGRPVRRNLSLAGWVQCSQFGAVGFRAEALAPACDWQGFTQ